MPCSPASSPAAATLTVISSSLSATSATATVVPSVFWRSAGNVPPRSTSGVLSCATALATDAVSITTRAEMKEMMRVMVYPFTPAAAPWRHAGGGGANDYRISQGVRQLLRIPTNDLQVFIIRDAHASFPGQLTSDSSLLRGRRSPCARRGPTRVNSHTAVDRHPACPVVAGREDIQHGCPPGKSPKCHVRLD